MSNFELFTCKDREEWLDVRHGVVSSTESAALFGMSPYITAFELAVGKQSKIPTEFEQNERMKWGTRLQAAIARGIEEDFGVAAYSYEWQFSKRTDLRMGSSFDYRVETSHSNRGRSPNPLLRDYYRMYGPGILEIKNVDAFQFRNEWIDGEAPEHIEVQLQHQLQCTDLQWGALAALVGGNRIELVIRKRDDVAGAAIVSVIKDFWETLRSGRMPDIDWTRDARSVAAQYGSVTEGKVMNVSEGSLAFDPDIIKWCEEYRQAHETLSIAEEVKETRKAMILQRITDTHKVIAGPYRISAGVVKATHVEYDRKEYRDFRITQPKVKHG